MQSLTVLLLLSSLTSATPLFKRSLPVKSGWTLAFSDDFTGAVNSLPSTNNWNILTGTQYPGGEPRWGNNEVQTYTKNQENLAITADKTLKITPRKSASGAWTSGRIETKNGWVVGEGHKLFVESRLKLGNAPGTQAQGIWPAFWALGTAFRGNYHNWPFVTEWDIVEMINGQVHLYSTVHCGVNPGGPCNEPSGVGSGGSNIFSRAVWHTIGFQVDRTMVGPGKKATWKDELITWYLDGKLIWTVKGSQVNDAAAWGQLAHRSHFLILNVAVGGNWAGPPNSKTIAGPNVGMEVDYVGVWTK